MSDEFNNDLDNNSGNREDNNKQTNTEGSQYRMSFTREENNDYSEPVNNYYTNPGSNFEDNGNKKRNKNMGPVWGIIAALLVLLLIGGGLIAVAKLTGADKEAEKKETEIAQVETTKEAESETEKTTEAEKTDETTADSGNHTGLTKGDSVPTTGNVTASLLDVSNVVDEVMPSIVAVTNTTMYSSSGSFNYWNWYFNQSNGGDDYKASGAGSGVIIAQNGNELMIATNAHVVIPKDYSQYGLSADTSEYSVTFCDEKQVAAFLKGYDEDMDLAVLVVKISDMDSDTLDSIKIATVGDSDKTKVGNGVIAIGNALGYGQSVTVGYVSALNREVKIGSVTRKLIQTDAAINPGNSGGGLFDVNGRLIGINSAKYSSTEIEGIGFAIPMNEAESILEDIMNTETVIREKVTDEDKKCYLGVKTSKQYVNAYDGQGAFVEGTEEDGPADKAGIMAYDIITELDGHSIKSWNDLLEELSYYEGGQIVTVNYYTLKEEDGRRKYVEASTEVTLGFMKDYVSENE